MDTRRAWPRSCRRWLVLAVLGAGGVAATAGALAAQAGSSDGPAFSAGSLVGRWGFSAAGTAVPPAAPEQMPAAAAGTMSFDGRGGCRIADMIDVAGAAGSRTSTSCRYAVDSDGRGTLTAEFADEPAPVPLAFVLIRDGTAFRFIRADAVVASGVAERQRVRSTGA